MLQQPPGNSSVKNVTVLKLQVLNIKKNTKAGALNNPYVLINKVNKII